MKIRFFLCFLITLPIASHAVGQQTIDRAKREAEQLFQRSDKDDDGKLSRDEFPKRFASMFGKIDVDSDGFITLEEDIAFRTKRSRAGGRNRATQLPQGYVAKKDIAYGPLKDRAHLLDVYYDQNTTEAKPLIVWIHGGGWRNGSKDRCPALRFLSKGFVVAGVNYRLTGEAIFPAQIHDCKAAIRFLRANAKQYGIDPDRIGVWGSSAGGHLVALVGTSGDVKTLEGTVGDYDDVSSRVQAVCDFFGPTDLLQMDAHALPTAPFKHDSADSPEAKLVGGPIQENKAIANQINPITYVTKDDPPFLICHGDQDPLVPLHQSKLLNSALTKIGVSVTFKTVVGAEHGFGGRADVDKAVDKFFVQTLAP